MKVGPSSVERLRRRRDDRATQAPSMDWVGLRSPLFALLLIGGSLRLVRVGGEPHLVIVEQVSTAPETVLQLVIQPLKASDLLIFVLTGHLTST